MDAALLASLPPVSRLALAYAPARSRGDWLCLLALDARLAAILRQGREPVLAQIRLAWWRERLQQPASERPAGEPLLARLSGLADAGAGLVALVDGWEALPGDAPLDAAAFEAFAAGRRAALCQIAARHGLDEVAVGSAALRWSFADLALHLGEPGERAMVQAMAAALPAGNGLRARAMRPLLVLDRLYMRAAMLATPHALTSPAALLLAMRIGLLGR